MRALGILATAFVIGCFSVSSVQAACTGSNGRGWASGNGAGKFVMTTADKACRIGFTNFIDDSKKTRIPATQVAVTRPPKSGNVTVTGKGLVYAPVQGFKGKDTFCTRNTTPKMKGKSLSGCITVTVR